MERVHVQLCDNLIIFYIFAGTYSRIISCKFQESFPLYFCIYACIIRFFGGVHIKTEEFFFQSRILNTFAFMMYPDCFLKGK